MDDTMALTFLRHGLTMENEKSIYIGWTDSSLSQKGRCSLEEGRIDLETVDRLYSSDLTRCLETAGILFPEVSVYKRSDLREISFGAFEGKAYDELKYNASYREWLDDPLSNTPDGGERFVDFQNRVRQAYKSIKTEVLDAHLQECVIVTHGGVIRQWLSNCFGNEFFSWKIPYGGGYRISGTKRAFRKGDERCMSLQEVPIMESRHG